MADIHDFHKETNMSRFQFTDSTGLVYTGRYLDVARDMTEGAIRAVLNFAGDWKIRINHQKTKA